MRLINFSVEKPFRTITLIGLNREWELHNFASFRGLSFFPNDDLLELRWTVPNVKNPWGCLHNHSHGCILRFRKLILIRVNSNDHLAQAEDEICLSGLSKVIPGTINARFKEEWRDDEPFNLLFEFRSGRTIEISSESAELEAIEIG
jgi:hypothetical protein